MWAEAKGVIKLTQLINEKIKLTEEGIDYLQNGFPEINLIKYIIENNQNNVGILKNTYRNFNIAISWIMKNKWATIRNDKILINNKGINASKNINYFDEYRSIIIENNYAEVPRDIIKNNDLIFLKSRNLIEENNYYENQAMLTNFGHSVLRYLQNVDHSKIITQLTPEILKNESWKGSVFQRYDVTLSVPSTRPGKRHFVSQVIDYIRRFWVELGFKEMTGEYLELNFWNFDALFQPQDHPARDLADTFYLKTPESGHLPDPEMVQRVKETHENGWTTGSTGWQYKWDPAMAARNCLRTHTTSLSVNAIAKLTEDDLPAKFFSVGRVFRNETIDWNHLAEFYQTDGIVVGEGVTFANMQGYLKAYLEGLGIKRFRFRPAYFPYTEMSMEAEVWIESRGAWMELFGAGMFRPEVVKPLLGKDVPVLAWGPGFERLVMESYRIERIGELYGNDLGLLRKAKLWME